MSKQALHVAAEFLSQRSSCRTCGSRNIRPFLKIPGTPVAGIYLAHDDAPPESDPCYPVTGVLCERCGLVQLLEVLSPAIYTGYRYSGTTSTIYQRYLDALAVELVDKFGCKHRRVVEIGCNDGYLLERLKNMGRNQVAGFEPATSLAPMLSERGIEVIPDLFGQGSAARMPFPKADLIVVRHVLEHIEDPNAFMAAIHECLSEDGLALIEVPDIDSIIDSHLFAHFYHEHQVYYSVRTLAALGGKHGLHVADSRIVEIHGGSVRMVFSKRQTSDTRKAPDISACGQRCEAYAAGCLGSA